MTHPWTTADYEVTVEPYLRDERRPSQREAMTTQHMVLLETLGLAVPMHMAELHNLSPEHLCLIAATASEATGSHGDALQFGGKHCAGTFTALARGLAAAALVIPGGIDFVGRHWCADPHCRADSRLNHADDRETTP
jgi:hypothetical protein